MNSLYPMKFRPILKSAIWGGEKILSYKSLQSEQSHIGESWEISGVQGSESVVANGELEGLTITDLLNIYGPKLLGRLNYERFNHKFPLLVKFIDAKLDLSIQVHPDDALASMRHNSNGKTEMWYVVDAEKSAKLRTGFVKSISPEEYISCINNNTIVDIVKEYEVEQGDCFFLPAGAVHSIGAGCFVAEIQQTSDITYRIYDFNRTDENGNKRELHTKQSIEAIDFSADKRYRQSYDRLLTDKPIEVVRCPYFTTSVLQLTKPISLDYHGLDSFVVLICTRGNALINDVIVKQGDTILLPATTDQVDIKTGQCNLLSTYIDSHA